MNEEQRELLRRWKKLVNMPTSELEYFLSTPEAKVAGLSRSQASSMGIRAGRDSARAILRMRSKGPYNWSKLDWDWAKRQVSFVARMSASKGPLVDDSGRPTRKLLSLWIWGHVPQGE